MKHIKKLSMVGACLLALTFLVTPETSSAEEDFSEGTVCCKDESTGCTDSLGNYWPTDEERTTSTCTEGDGFGID